MVLIQKFYGCLEIFATATLILNLLHIAEFNCNAILTPSMTVPVCHGEQLMLTCSTSTGLQRWTIVDPNTGMSYPRLISVPTTPGTIVSHRVQSLMFNFAVISPLHALPLISALTVDDVTDYLNTSTISCLELETGISEMVSVHILSDPSGALEGLDLDYRLVDQNFGIDNASVGLLLNESIQGIELIGFDSVYYNITASSSQVKILNEYQERTRFQLAIPYNIQINISIIACLCGQYSIPTIIPQIYYTNCGQPPVNINDSITIIGYTQHLPVMEGINVNFSCNLGHILSGPSSSTCMRNGEWEPDPMEVECRAVSECRHPLPHLTAEMDPLLSLVISQGYNNSVSSNWSAVEGTTVSFTCSNDKLILIGPKSSTCMENGEWKPDPMEVKCRHRVNCGPPLTPQYGHVHPFASTLEGEEVLFSCRKSFEEVNLTILCSGNATWIPNPREFCADQEYSTSGISDVLITGIISSSVAFVLTAIICFFIGGCVCTKLTKCAKGNAMADNLSIDYEDVAATRETWPRDKKFELKENVAYASVQQQN